MADAVATQIIMDGSRKAIMKFTNISDGTGEAAVLKVNVSTLSAVNGKPCTSVTIEKMEITTHGMGLDILWDATTDVLALSIGPNISQTFDFTRFGGLTNNAGAGVTGNILFSTFDATLGDRYTVILELIKNFT